MSVKGRERANAVARKLLSQPSGRVPPLAFAQGELPKNPTPAEGEAEELLIQLCDTIEATGGITYDRKGMPAPVGDPEWVDLGLLYVGVQAA